MAKYYNFDEVDVIIDGVKIKEFMGDSNAIQITYDKDQFTSVVGTNGNVVVCRELNQMGKITLDLLQTATDNEVLSTLLNAQLNGAFVTVSIAITDLNGDSLHAGAKCWLQKFPDVSYGKEVVGRTWVFAVDKLISNIGSSSEAGSK